MRQRNTIFGVKSEELDNYSPDEYDAVPNEDGTYDLVPLAWTNQAEFMEYAFGTGGNDD